MTQQPQHAQIHRVNPNRGPLVVDDLVNADPLEVIRLCYRVSGLPQYRFAELMGVWPSTLSEWMNENNPASTLAARSAILAILMMGVPVQMPNPSQYLPTLTAIGKRRAKR